MASHDLIELEIESLAYGRAGIGRHDGKVVFVERTAPGDRVLVRLTEDHGSYLIGEAESVTAYGPGRADPPCPIVDRCGGCPWQHVDRPTQLAAKRANVIDALERIGGCASPPVEPVRDPGEAFNYRNRLKLRFDRNRLGFYSARSHSLVPIDDCMIAEPRVREALGPVSAFLPSLSTRPVRVEIAERGMLDGVVVAINAAGRLRRADGYKISEFIEAKDNPVAGVVMWGKGWSREWGETGRRHRNSNATVIESHGASFGQVNTTANRTLVETVMDVLAPTPSTRVLDLYAGAGNFTFPIARRAGEVVAVERDASAVEFGQAAAKRAKIVNVRFESASVDTFVAGDTCRYDRVVVNPPRSGLRGAAEGIARIGASDIVYVSCNPTTLARDVKVFTERGYALASVMPIDLFPNTFHVESVCHARLT